MIINPSLIIQEVIFDANSMNLDTLYCMGHDTKVKYIIFLPFNYSWKIKNLKSTSVLKPLKAFILLSTIIYLNVSFSNIILYP